MLFHSWQFILVFLPLCYAGYFTLKRRRLAGAAKLWLVAASLLFYSYWNARHLPLMLASIGLNFLVGSHLAHRHQARGSADARARWLLGIAIAANLLLLGYYKYTDFLLQNVNALFGASVPLRHIVLPLAISFFTFTQIAYLVDSYRGETARYDLLNYTLFVTYFPHLIAGPIVHHGHIMPQFQSRWTWTQRYPNIRRGLLIFAIGLFKKAVIADTFAAWSDAGFDGGHALGFVEAWSTSLSYTFQLYFDFSGYCDMAVGASLLFNIWLPANFNSPYKALDIQDFWRRWHITLGHFLRDYIYVPLGGNRGSSVHTYLNLFVTFLLGGLWHGASWMFVIWGALHGGALVVHRAWKRRGLALPRPLAWLATFLFVNVAWVFFRAKNLADAKRVLAGMFAPDMAWSVGSAGMLPVLGARADTLARWLPVELLGQMSVFMALALAFVMMAQRNAVEIAGGRLGARELAMGGVLMAAGLLFTLSTTNTIFLYFNF